MFTDNITLGIPYSTREVNFKSLVISGTDTIKAFTLIYCVVAAIILQDLGVRHFGDENVHMLCFM